MTGLRIRCLILILCLLPLSAQAANYCPDYFTPTHAPALDLPDERGFRFFWNRWLSDWYDPYHMIHDTMVPAGQSATLVGKFDYDKFLHKDLEFEYVHAYLFGTGMNDWEYLGRYRTDSDGKVRVNVGQRPVGDYQVRMVVQGDLTTATGFLTVINPNRKAVLFDIDGTLTLNDFEAVGDYLGISNAQMHNGARETVWAYLEKGYQVVYLTARQYWLARSTRNWFNRNGLIHWHLRTDPNAENPIDPDSVAHKTGVIRQLKEAGLDIIRAYGNSDTDLESYLAGGIPRSETFIIGELAGEDGTQPIHGDYVHHLSTVVANTPDAGCTWR